MATERNFSNQNLRNRSFRGQDLQQADFRGSDLRGCNFDLAQLQGANFNRSRVGYGPESILIGLLVIAAFGGLACHAISQMLFGVLGTTGEDPAFPYLWALLVCLSSAGGSCATLNRSGHPFRVLKAIAGLTTSALLGFFYGGVLMDNDPQGAAITAGIAAVAGAIISLIARTRLVTIAISTVGGCAAYGLCFFCGTRASSLLSVHHVWAGGYWGLLALFCLGVTLRIIAILLAAVQDFAHTSWRGANLSQATFANIQINEKQMSRYGLSGYLLAAVEEQEQNRVS